jgi:uncharacterized SAM-binding protein YcdF (DUF218 family)
LFFVNTVLILIPAVWFGYQPLLRFAAGILVIASEPQPADAIVVLGGGEPGRAREAVDLYRAKMAHYVVVTAEPPAMAPDQMEELRELGIELAESNENYLRILRGMGVPEENTIRMEPYVADTIDELRAVRELCRKRSWKSVLIVTSNYHTRRTRLISRYVLEPVVQATVIGARYGGIDRNDWWTKTGQVRTFLIEFQKLVAYTFYIWPGILWTAPDDTKPSSISSEFPGSLSMPVFLPGSSYPDGVFAFASLPQVWRHRSG